MTAPLSPTDGRLLAGLAASAVRARLSGVRLTATIPPSGPLHADGASFVTLELAGTLRGCVGTLEPVRPLHRDVVHNAVRAMQDPRVPPVTAADWPALDVKVSVLDRPAALPATTRQALLAALVPQVHGLILTDGTRRATFLPSVWSKLPSPEQFVDALLRKGGWREWPPDMRALGYGSTEYEDRSPRRPL
ncbi:AmmeMemoRadiSam system protein A [Dactylosporangium aurantiacum]|uniref:AmmeMemoRadiSam system protein A n=1 Tax=Dactylosporangium aurantiacum TaxID=35754 RepID=A0A9Q9ILS5_9ACTN|nr:AmmeMemoRadiSam system protein A [Dactylosporangium aurantiacum]MDG6100557.1 AmmeMemoRadiSam system protein A [Dactylosporangium aurantiacum]UWZ55348.1 AmmeMemoRadiSam system protein A [Dactylosporangium aurantiacum]